MASHLDFRLEDSLPELEEQLRRGVWSGDEVRLIVRERRQHELSLMRAGATRDDYLKFIAFEVNLDQLRAERVARLGIKQRSFLLVHSGVVRVQATFERLVARLGNADASLWIEYALYCRRVHSLQKLEKVFARALRLHPASEPLWILAAAHEFEENSSVDGARVLLQRGLRLNGESRRLWVELLRLELLNVDKLRARQTVLGLDPDSAELPDEDEVPAAATTDDDDAAPSSQRRGLYDSDSEELSDDSALGSDGDKFYNRVTHARERRKKRKQALEAAAAPSARARALARRAFFDGALAGVVMRRAFTVFPRDWQLRIDMIRIAMLFPFVHALVDEQIEHFEATFGAQADAVAALCELLSTTLRANTATPWRSWRECVALFERAVQHAKQADADNDAAGVPQLTWPSASMRSALLRFLLARVADGVVETAPHVILNRLARDEPIFGKIVKRKGGAADDDDSDEAIAALMQSEQLRFSADGYALLTRALLRGGKLALAAASLRHLVEHAEFATVPEAQRIELTRLLAATNASLARVEHGAAASYRAGALTFRTTEPMSLGLVAKEFLAILDGELDNDDEDDGEDERAGSLPPTLARALIFYEEVMSNCPRDVEAIERFQICCLNGVAARFEFEAVAQFYEHAAGFPPQLPGMRDRFIGCAVTHGKLAPANAVTTRRAFEAAVRAEPENEALWRRWLRFESDVGDLARCGEIQWRMAAALQSKDGIDDDD